MVLRFEERLLGIPCKEYPYVDYTKRIEDGYL